MLKLECYGSARKTCVNHVNSQSSIDIHNSLLRGGINMLILDEQQQLHWVTLATSSVTTITWLHRALIIGTCFNEHFFIH